MIGTVVSIWASILVGGPFLRKVLIVVAVWAVVLVVAARWRRKADLEASS